MKITHYDLFAGIGGFSYALDQVFYDQEIKHIFCEWESFPTAVLKKHWPEGTYYGDIADLVTDTECERLERSSEETTGHTRQRSGEWGDQTQNIQHAANTSNTRTKTMHKRQKPPSKLTIVTGGFPCQPFSHAGRRKGTEDDRYKWPEMFEVIKNTQPDWVIAENVRGFVTWNEGMVLERTCADLESEGYEVQPFIIPACAVQAPHQRERVWIVANHRGAGLEEARASKQTEGCWRGSSGLPKNSREGVFGNAPHRKHRNGCNQSTTWNQDWREVAFATCHDKMDDGLPRRMGNVTISGARYRREALKAYGNAIVPQVAMEIFKSIRQTIK